MNREQLSTLLVNKKIRSDAYSLNGGFPMKHIALMGKTGFGKFITASAVRPHPW